MPITALLTFSHGVPSPSVQQEEHGLDFSEESDETSDEEFRPRSARGKKDAKKKGTDRYGVRPCCLKMFDHPSTGRRSFSSSPVLSWAAHRKRDVCRVRRPSRFCTLMPSFALHPRMFVPCALCARVLECRYIHTFVHALTVIVLRMTCLLSRSFSAAVFVSPGATGRERPSSESFLTCALCALELEGRCIHTLTSSLSCCDALLQATQQVIAVRVPGRVRVARGHREGAAVVSGQRVNVGAREGPQQGQRGRQGEGEGEGETTAPPRAGKANAEGEGEGQGTSRQQGHRQRQEGEERRGGCRGWPGPAVFGYVEKCLLLLFSLSKVTPR